MGCRLIECLVTRSEAYPKPGETLRAQARRLPGAVESQARIRPDSRSSQATTRPTFCLVTVPEEGRFSLRGRCRTLVDETRNETAIRSETTRERRCRAAPARRARPRPAAVRRGRRAGRRLCMSTSPPSTRSMTLCSPRVTGVVYGLFLTVDGAPGQRLWRGNRDACAEARQPPAGSPSQRVNQERTRSRTSTWWVRSVNPWFSRG